MQETRYFDEDGLEQRQIEFFEQPASQDKTDRLVGKMNRRLFELEGQGHTLVQQRSVSLSEKMAIEKANKAKKKLNRIKKRQLVTF